MTAGGLFPAPDVVSFRACGYTVASEAGDHPCNRPAVASAVGPHGERLPLCRLHERTALAAVSLPRFSDWQIEETS